MNDAAPGRLLTAAIHYRDARTHHLQADFEGTPIPRPGLT